MLKTSQATNNFERLSGIRSRRCRRESNCNASLRRRGYINFRRTELVKLRSYATAGQESQARSSSKTGFGVRPETVPRLAYK